MKEINKGGIVRLVIFAGSWSLVLLGFLRDVVEYVIVIFRLRGKGVGVFIY